MLTTSGLACWIMDQGKSSYNQTIIYTRFFSKNEIFYIQVVFNKNFDLTIRIQEKTKNQLIIYIPIKQKN